MTSNLFWRILFRKKALLQPCIHRCDFDSHLEASPTICHLSTAPRKKQPRHYSRLTAIEPLDCRPMTLSPSGHSRVCSTSCSLLRFSSSGQKSSNCDKQIITSLPSPTLNFPPSNLQTSNSFPPQKAQQTPSKDAPHKPHQDGCLPSHARRFHHHCPRHE